MYVFQNLSRGDISGPHIGAVTQNRAPLSSKILTAHLRPSLHLVFKVLILALKIIFVHGFMLKLFFLHNYVHICSSMNDP